MLLNILLGNKRMSSTRIYQYQAQHWELLLQFLLSRGSSCPRVAPYSADGWGTPTAVVRRFA